METINPNLKSCMNDKEVVVKSRTTKVVDKSRQTTLVSPNVQGAKKKAFERAKGKPPSKNPQTGNVSQKLVNTVVQTFPNLNSIIPTVFPHQSVRPPFIPFVQSPATQNQVINPYTQHVYVPAFIPVAAANANMNQPLTYLAPATPQMEGALKIKSPQLKELPDKELNRFDKGDDKYHSSELDYFLGGNAQYLEERSRRKRSRSFSSRSSAFSRSSSQGRKRKRRYSPRSNRSWSRSSFDRSTSLRSYDRYKNRSSGRHSSLSKTHSNSFRRSQSITRSYSFERSLSRSLSPPRADSNHVGSHSRSPVSEQSFRGSFLTVSQASSRDSVRSRSRERSISHLYDDHLSDVDSLSEYRGDSIHRRYIEELHHERRGSFSSRNNSFNDTSPAAHGSDFMGTRYRSERHHRYHSSREHTLKPEEFENVSDFEDVSDFEEVSEFEDISDSDTSVTWQDGQSRSQSRISGTYYETVSDNEEAGDGESTKLVTNNDAETTDNKPSTLDDKYDGYLDPRIHKPVNDFEEVSDVENEIHFDNSQSPVKGDKFEKVSDSELNVSIIVEEKISSSAPLSEQNVGTDMAVIVEQDMGSKVDQERASQAVVIHQGSGNSDNWQAVSKSAIQVYENLGLVKDENNKLIYIGQESASLVEEEASSSVAIADKSVTLGESFQGYVKTLWQFPHKGVLHMSLANFREESEAYQDEIIAEIIHIILSLDLPYVTLNKLRNVIREKIKINVISVDELRQILVLYPNHFILTKHSGSDSDDDEDQESKTSTIRVNVAVQVRLCERHKVLPFSKDTCPCSALHICQFYLLRKCSKSECALGHDLKTPHNANIIKEYRLHRSTLAEIVEQLRNVAHRGVDTVPAVCKFYNRRRGCSKESETDDNDEMCTELHLCFFYAVDSCRKGTDCDLAHNIMTGQPLVLLQKYGLDPNEYGEFNVLSLIRTFLRIRRQEFETLHEKMSGKTLTENEVKLCVAKGINPRLLQLKNVKAQQIGAANTDINVTNITEKSDFEKQATSPKKNSGTLKAVDEQDRKSQWTTLSLQMRAQKVLIERALKSPDDSNSSSVNKLSDQKPVIPLVCKFYNNETGCARKNETCEFIHVCHHYVMGDCKYNDRCKRSHDLKSCQPETILSRLGLVNKSEDEIIAVLRKLCGETLVSEESELSSA